MHYYSAMIKPNPRRFSGPSPIFNKRGTMPRTIGKAFEGVLDLRACQTLLGPFSPPLMKIWKMKSRRRQSRRRGIEDSLRRVLRRRMLLFNNLRKFPNRQLFSTFHNNKLRSGGVIALRILLVDTVLMVARRTVC